MSNASLNLAQCWAKTWTSGIKAGHPGLTVRDHCINVGAIAQELIDKLPKPVTKLLPEGTTTLIASHDIGKITPDFQRKCLHWHHDPARVAKGETSHAKISHQYLSELPDFIDHRGAPTDWLLAISGHHGRYETDRAGRLRAGSEFPNDWPKSLRAELWKEIVELFGPPPKELLYLKPRFDANTSRVHLLTGFMIFCDWLGSDESTFPLSLEPSQQEPISLEKSRTLALSSVQSLGYHHREVHPNLGFSDLFRAKGKTMQPRPLQQRLLDLVQGPGLYIVEAPMGLGKTEAALAAAYQRWNSPEGERGLYFALPTQLTSQRIHQRVSSFLEKVIQHPSALALAHGNAWLREDRVLQLSPSLGTSNEDDRGAADAYPWFASTTRRALLAPFGTGTIDQALLSVLPAKHAALRFFGLAGKVVVFDEVHSYDAYTSALLERCIQWLLHAGCTVIVLSATLTAERRKALVAAAHAEEPEVLEAYPLITRVRKGAAKSEAFPVSDDSRKSLSVQIQLSDPEDSSLWEKVDEAAANGACVLIIRNSVALAQETYRVIKSTARGDAYPVALIHSRFPQWQRDAQEEYWTQRLGSDGSHRPHGCVLISTQVVEQSVDIDSDWLITDLCPSDLILQRMGRLHRHERVRPPTVSEPVCTLLIPKVDWNADELTIKKQLAPHSYIYPSYTLFQSYEVWKNRASVTLPNEIRNLLETTYQAPKSDLPQGVQKLKETLDAEIQRMISTALARPALGVSVKDIEGSQTRWGTDETAYLILLSREPQTLGKAITLHWHDGTERPIDPHRFDLSLAKELHRYAVKIPAYLVRGAAAKQPDWLKLHIENAVLAVCSDSSTHCEIIGIEEPHYRIQYHHEWGVSHVKSEGFNKPTEPDIFDTSQEDSWY